MDWRDRIDRAVDGLEETLRTARRHLHAHPEPSGEEIETTRFLAALARERGLSVREAKTGCGAIVEPPHAPAVPRVALRADIDALRIQDEKPVPYRSKVDGVTHACGHDAHAACVLGAAFALEDARADLPWPVAWRAILQPAEESSEGGIEMVAEGAMEGVRAIVAVHVDPERLAGRVGFRTGTLTAFCCEIDVVVHGRGGHAARPHHTSDPIAAACQFASAVYQSVPRSIDSRDPTVVTFGCIQGGSTQNVIPEHVRLRGTARACSHASISKVEERVRAIAAGIGEATGTRIETAFKHGPSAVVNDARVTEVCRSAARELLGTANLDEILAPSMGGEDFAEYLAHAPGCLMRLGVGRDGAEHHFLHSARFDLDEAALLVGAKLLARCVVHLSKDA